jgi:hypothetical protein
LGGSRHAIAAEGHALLVTCAVDPYNAAPLTAVAAR